jgi:SAM-dependent methyltransferase
LTKFSLKRIRSLLTRPLSDHADGLSWYFHEAQYFSFTRRHSLDFGGFIPREELVVGCTESLADSNNYRPYSNFHLKRLLREAFYTGIRFENFVDVGCGKGHPCIFGQKYGNFPRVYGIDFSPPLIEIAKENLAKTNLRNVTLLVADATTWKLPAGASLILLNNPFREVILEKFVVSNLEHFKRHRSLIAYGNDFYRSTLCGLGFEIIYRSNRHNQSILEYSGSPKH